MREEGPGFLFWVMAVGAEGEERLQAVDVGFIWIAFMGNVTNGEGEEWVQVPAGCRGAGNSGLLSVHLQSPQGPVPTLSLTLGSCPLPGSSTGQRAWSAILTDIRGLQY